MTFNPYYLGGNTIVEGVVVARPAGYCFRAMDRINAQISNIKCLGAWQYSTDGASTSFGFSSTLKNTFFKQNDDTFTLYASNGVIEDSVVFKQSNGAVF